MKNHDVGATQNDAPRTASSAHTPSPWTVQITKPTRGNRHGDVMIIAGGVAAIDANQSGDTFSESAANAILIASAPDMLDDFRNILRRASITSADNFIECKRQLMHIQAIARAAIAKATGAAP